MNKRAGDAAYARGQPGISPVVLFALLCLALIGYTSYPLLHHFFTTAVQPWYTLELFCVSIVISLTA